MTESTFGNQCLDQTLCQQVEYSLKTRITPVQSLDGENCPVGNSCIDLYYDNPYVEKIVTEAGYSIQIFVNILFSQFKPRQNDRQSGNQRTFTVKDFIYFLLNLVKYNRV